MYHMGEIHELVHLKGGVRVNSQTLYPSCHASWECPKHGQFQALLREFVTSKSTANEAKLSEAASFVNNFKDSGIILNSLAHRQTVTHRGAVDCEQVLRLVKLGGLQIQVMS